jgi:chromosomal replication initiation ATPase DnaA
VLRSDRAIQVNIAIMRTFIQLRRQKDFQTESLQKFRNLEDKLDEMHCRIEQLEDRSKNRSQASLVINRKDQIELANVPLNVAGANQGDKVIQIQHRVSKYFQLKVNDLKSDSRTRALVYARQIAIYLIRENLRLGFKEIGTHFCGRDHTTILHSYRKIHTKIKKDRSTEEAVFSIQKII